MCAHRSQYLRLYSLHAKNITIMTASMVKSEHYISNELESWLHTNIKYSGLPVHHSILML